MGIRKKSALLRDVHANAVHASPMVAPPLVSIKRGLLIATIAGLFMSFVGAFGTGAAPFWVRLGYWMLVMETGALIGLGVSLGTQHWGRLREHLVLEGLLIAFLIAIPLSIVVTSSNALFFETPISGIADFLMVAGIVFVVSCAITTLNYVTSPPPPQLATGPVIIPSETPRETGRFMDRLPIRLRHARLIALQAEDHYLRVHTDAGSDLILMRLSDAVNELDDIVGARTHRSWWVARDAVEAVENEGGRTVLILAENLRAPVSRSSRPILASTGWFS